MDFADDDLLADILSDGSNDSFFDEPKLTTKKSVTNLPKELKDSKIGKTINDWLSSDAANKDSGGNKTDVEVKDDWLGLGITKDSDIASSPSLSKKTVKKISFEDDDILGTLGLNKKLPTTKAEDTHKEEGIHETKGKKSEFLESILKSSKKEETFEDILKNSHSRNEGDPMVDFQKYRSGPDIPRESRRKRVSSGLVDPLGLFADESKNELATRKKTDEIKHTRAHSFSSGDIKDIDNLSSNKSNFGDTARSAPNLFEPQALPDWLGTSSESKVSETVRGFVHSTKSKSEITLIDKNGSTSFEEPIVNAQSSQPTRDTMGKENSKSQAHFLNSLFVNQKMAQSHMEYQSTAISLQQQESQILMALQMKKYEDNLMEIQRQQQEILNKQEQQFNALLEREFVKQHAMENNMRLQQERINNHIQLLLSQPKVDVPIQHLKEDMGRAEQSAEVEHLKASQDLINYLKERQREEIFILEESYKKQISILEETAHNTEKRMKKELENALSRNEEYVKYMAENYDKELNKLKRKIEEIDQDHVKELKLTRDNHMRVIDEIRNEHSLIIENIKEFKRSEGTILKDSDEFGRKLETNIELLFGNTQTLRNMSDKIGTDYGVLHTAREETLKAREKEIEMMRSTLNKCRESAEAERTQLLGLVASLETKTVEQTQAGREERWTLQQAMSTLAGRSAAFDRETEFARASIEKEREQMKALKESMLAEQERVILQLTEEKLTISAEKARLETSNKLNMQFDIQKSKAELEAAMQVAKEASEITYRERESLQKQLCEVESRTRSLRDRERKIASRESELTQLIQAAETKLQEGEKALEESKTIEMRCNERMKQLQFQLLQLSNREKKITEEKIALSKERISLNNLIQQKKSSNFSVDNLHTDQQKGDWNDDFDREGVPHFPRFDVSEAEILRLQFEDQEENPITFKNS